MTASRIILRLASIAFVTGLVVGGIVIISEPGTGHLAGIEILIGLAIIAIGNLVSFVLGLIAWLLGARSRVVSIVLLVQALPAVVVAIFMMRWLADDISHQRAVVQRAAVLEAVWQDNPEAYEAAHAACGELCQARSTRSYELMEAVQRGSTNMVRHLVDARLVPEKQGWNESAAVATCDGRYISSLGVLSVAIAQRKNEIAEILIPITSAEALDEAMRLSISLSRLDWAQRLIDAGAPVEYPKDDARVSLLSAAAAGGALDAAQWLVEKHSLKPTRQDAQEAFEQLFHFMEQTGDHRSLALGKYLVSLGADPNSRFRNSDSYLQEAIVIDRGDIAHYLIGAGADPSSLNAELRKKLDAMDKTPQNLFSGGEPEDCIR